ncbi:hypothetical protein [Streptomyces sp. DH37]|uniref:hypothetical protein n=1 Tax=Streptomyces sp. DH37 TaxID=3040122 RepID=UPI002442C0B9|nr:hypothetical protein [Streptomyces sp. DH37]MDG9703741.1 hypothetical protein [Streptomyces sp. DH37]
MDDLHPDQETRDAIRALAMRLRARDAAAAEGEEPVDAEVFAAEYITALRTRGWRPTPARPAPPWQRTLPPATPETAQQRAAEIRAELRRRRPCPPDGGEEL